ncbi:MAG TPA: ATP-binding protein [Ignavibacteriaceae bacterium]|nr:ATP-binding protein [Ignavibacteriaceae bacterium]
MIDDTIQNNKLHILGKLTAGLIHEIRNPLSAVKLGLAHLDLMKNELPVEAIDIVNASTTAMERIENLIYNLLDFSKKNNYQKEAININLISDQALSFLNSNFQKTKIVVEKNYADNLPIIFVSKFRLLQLFLNLISNAIESFCDKNNEGTITIKTFIVKNTVLWQIKDNGIGITEENKEKIFNDFYTNKDKGVGLGLSVCSQILNEYQSKIEFESKYGAGSVFTIMFNSNLLRNE